MNVGSALLFDIPPAEGWQDLARARGEERHALRLRSRDRNLRERERRAALQVRLPWLELPRTVGDCRGEGVCPVLRCKYHLALWVNDRGAIKVGRGQARDADRRPGKSGAGFIPVTLSARAAARRIEQIADMVVELADRLPSLCLIDYAELGPMTLTGLAEVLGCTKQQARSIVNHAQAEARHALDIVEAKERRAQLQARTSPLVQIRPRPVAVMRPTARELDRVGHGPKGAL